MRVKRNFHNPEVVNELETIPEERLVKFFEIIHEEEEKEIVGITKEGVAVVEDDELGDAIQYFAKDQEGVRPLKEFLDEERKRFDFEL